jgi:hypothetical protein
MRGRHYYFHNDDAMEGPQYRPFHPPPCGIGVESGRRDIGPAVARGVIVVTNLVAAAPGIGDQLLRHIADVCNLLLRHVLCLRSIEEGFDAASLVAPPDPHPTIVVVRAPSN